MKHPEPPSPRQADVLDVVVRVYRATQEPVSSALIARRLNLSRGTVREHLIDLHEKGWLETDSAAAIPAPDYLK